MALSDLKTASEPVVTYDVTGYFDTAIGDTVEIEDEEYVPTLYLSARVSEQVRSFTNPQANKTVFTNFKELQSEISEDLLQKVEDLINKTKIYTSSISTDNGIVFKNNEGFTNLTANVIDNVVDRTDNFTIRWFKDGNHIYAGRTIKVRALDVESKAVYKFEARDTEGILRGFEEVTVMDVSDGTDERMQQSSRIPRRTIRPSSGTIQSITCLSTGMAKNGWKHTRKTSRMRKMLREMLRNPQIQQSLA